MKYEYGRIEILKKRQYYINFKSRLIAKKYKLYYDVFKRKNN